MAIKDIFKVSRKTFFNPAAWIGYNEVKNSSIFMWDTIKQIFYPPVATRTETFEQALKRLDLNEETIHARAQEYLLYAFVFLFLGIFTIVFSVYLLSHHHTFAGFLLGLAVTALFLSQAFRYHFWFFQIKHRKLGCTFDEWLKGKVTHQGN